MKCPRKKFDLLPATIADATTAIATILAMSFAVVARRRSLVASLAARRLPESLALDNFLTLSTLQHQRRPISLQDPSISRRLEDRHLYLYLA
jgi:hypothetical protein